MILSPLFTLSSIHISYRIRGFSRQLSTRPHSFDILFFLVCVENGIFCLYHPRCTYLYRIHSLSSFASKLAFFFDPFSFVYIILDVSIQNKRFLETIINETVTVSPHFLLATISEDRRVNIRQQRLATTKCKNNFRSKRCGKIVEIKDVGNMFQVCATRTRCTLRRSLGRALSSTVT